MAKKRTEKDKYFDFVVDVGRISCHSQVWFFFYMDSLNETRGLFYVNIHEAKKALIEDISQVNRAHLTVLVSVENIYILHIA